nr:DUF1553 domain-containing protein [Pyrinomonadaceae bacterium]
GERWARPWLDLARYADTNGYEKDRRRSAWKYRDWVINAFNQDMPFDRFTIEQIAGDMIPNATTEQRIATGFHRNAMLNEEGGVDPEETRWETLVDRVSTTATVWLGTTLACAQCHNHKYDPLTQKEFYRFLAFFNNAEYELVGPANVSEQKLSEPKLELPTQEQAARRRELEAEIGKLKAIIESPSSELEAGQAAWEREVTRAENDWITLDTIDVSSTGGSTLTKSADKTILVTGENPEKDTYVVTAKTNLQNITGLRLEVLTDPKLPQNGPGRDPYGNFILTGFEVEAAPLTADSAKDTQQLPSLAFTDAVADDAQRGLEVKNLVKREAKTSEVYLAKESKGWGIDATKENSRINRQAVFVAEKPFGTGTETLLKIKLKHEAGYIGQGIGRFRLSVTTAQNPTSVVNVVAPLRFILAIPIVHRTEQQKKDLATYYRSTTSPQLKATRDRLVELRKSLDKLGIVSSLVMQERSSYERPSTYLRIRGSYTAKGEQVFAGVPEALHPLSENQPANRLGLARWLVDENNPLTARVAVNQFWEQFFGRGIVETSEDFGTQGQRPTHPELLDWLATEFVREGWSMKKLHRLVVTSATYRQSAKATPTLLERDPYNRLLARGPRFRLEAEMIRDMALAASGQLSRKIGGPSVFPSQPEGVWSIPYNDDQWRMSEGEDRFRRGLYTFIRRTSPYPGLTNFDAPSREFCTVRRVRTNTPLQALTTLNDLAYFDAARSLAKRIMTEAGADERARAVLGFRLCVSRRPKAEELDQIIALYNEQRARFKQSPEAARKVAHGPETTEKTDGDVAPSPTEGDAAETAAWVMTANILLNLDETITKE